MGDSPALACPASWVTIMPAVVLEATILACPAREADTVVAPAVRPACTTAPPDCRICPTSVGAVAVGVDMRRAWGTEVRELTLEPPVDACRHNNNQYYSNPTQNLFSFKTAIFLFY